MGGVVVVVGGGFIGVVVVGCGGVGGVIGGVIGVVGLLAGAAAVARLAGAAPDVRALAGDGVVDLLALPGELLRRSGAAVVPRFDAHGAVAVVGSGPVVVRAVGVGGGGVV